MMRLLPGLIFLLLVFFLISPHLQPVSAVEIQECQDIRSSGMYVLTADVYGVQYGKDYCIGIFADNVILDGNGYSVEGAEIRFRTTQGVRIVEANNVTIKNLRISKYDYGIYMRESNYTTIINNIVELNVITGIYLRDSHHNEISSNNIVFNGGGIYLENSHNNAITDNTISSNSQHGIELVFSIKTMILNNTVSSNGYGILLDASNNNTVIGNDIESNTAEGVYLDSSRYNEILVNTISSNGETGIYLVYSDYNTILNNTVSLNGQHGIELVFSIKTMILNNTVSSNTFDGVYLAYSDYGIISGNTISSNGDDGIELEASNKTIIVNNTVSLNTFSGIYVHSSSKYNMIFNNVFNNSINVVLDDAGRNYWNTTRIAERDIVGGNYLGGNYWGSPYATGFSDTCGDRDRDGICDSPFQIDENNTDWLPLSRPVQPPPSITLDPGSTMILAMITVLAIIGVIASASRLKKKV